MNKIDVSLNNSEYFKLAIGKRITKKQFQEYLSPPKCV